MRRAEVPADEWQSVHRFDYLIRPAVLDRRHFEARCGEGQESLETLHRILVLPGLVVFTSHEEQRPSIRGLAADVVIRVFRVPEQPERRFLARFQAQSQNVGKVARDLRLQQHVLEGRVRGHDHVARGHRSFRGDHAARLSILDIDHARVFEHVASIARNREGQGQEIAAGMKLRLSIEAKGARHLEGQGDLAGQGHFRADTRRGSPLRLQFGHRLRIFGVLKCGDPREVADHLFLAHEGFYPRQRDAAGLGGEPGVVFAEVFDQLPIAAIERLRDVSRGVPTHALGHPLGLDHGHGEARLLQEGGRGQTGDSRPDDGHIHGEVGLQGGEALALRHRDPKGLRIIGEFQETSL